MKMTLKMTVLAALAAALLTGCGGGASGDLAKVNGKTITMEEFHNYLETKNTVRVVVQGQVVELPVADTLAFQAMQDLVAQKVLLQTAADEKVAPTPQEVDEEIKFRQKLQPTYIQTLNTRGLSTGQIRDMVEVQLAQERLITKGVKVTKNEREDVVKKNPNLFIEPAKAALELLFVRTEAKKAEADQALRSGSGFTNVRSRLDESPANLRTQFDSTRMAGDGIELAKLNEPFRSAVAKTGVGQQTAWMRAGGGWARILVHNKKAAKPLEKTPERLSFLDRQIALDKGARGKDVTKRVSDKLKTSKIEIVEPTLKTPWQRFEARLKEAADTTKIPKNE